MRRGGATLRVPTASSCCYRRHPDHSPVAELRGSSRSVAAPRLRFDVNCASADPFFVGRRETVVVKIAATKVQLARVERIAFENKLRLGPQRGHASLFRHVMNARGT